MAPGPLRNIRWLQIPLLLLVASFFFKAYLPGNAGVSSSEKALGVLALASWLVAAVVRRERARLCLPMVALCGLVIWAFVSAVFTGPSPAHLINASRYLMFSVLFFLVFEEASRSWGDLERIVDVAVASATVAASIGILQYVARGTGRAAGPLAGADDFAFLLASVLPLALWRGATSSTRPRRVVACAASAIIALAIASTLSRGAAVGLFVAFGWLVVAKRLPFGSLRTLVVLVGVALVAVGAWGTGLLGGAGPTRAAVEAANSASRLHYWHIAVAEFRYAPILGVGPGNYEAYFPAFGPPYDFLRGVQTTHSTFLNILAELGLPGIALFVGFLSLIWRELRGRHPIRGRARGLQSAIGAGLVAVIVASGVLTEQFYPPIWFLAALAAALPLVVARRALVTATPETRPRWATEVGGLRPPSMMRR
jgi:putative inorganic carbon (HCO3(-)) transporter